MAFQMKGFGVGLFRKIENADVIADSLSHRFLGQLQCLLYCNHELAILVKILLSRGLMNNNFLVPPYVEIICRKQQKEEENQYSRGLFYRVLVYTLPCVHHYSFSTAP